MTNEMTNAERTLLRSTLTITVQAQISLFELGTAIAEACGCDLELIYSWAQATAFKTCSGSDVSKDILDDFFQMLAEQLPSKGASTSAPVRIDKPQ